ncbi:MAG: glycosyltransferase family 39 protein [Elusimicrobia bacterium]|nr:glycosyltransferase family 39 protein [Elusimicrobiota bacterium]
MAANLIVMLAISWRKWADIWIDYGRELYTAWRLADGEPLYHSVDSMFGPLPSYLNAAVFKIFGPGVIQLALWNTALVLLFSIFLYRFCLSISNRAAAVLCVIAFHSIFAFSQYTFMGSLNFICPYSHSLTYGVMLALLSCFAICRYAETGRFAMLAGAGILCGLAFLCKAETFLPPLLSGLVALACRDISARHRARTLLLHQTLFLIFCAFPAAVAAGALTLQMPLGTAISGILLQYKALIFSGIPDSYYGSVMGLENIRQNMAHIAMHFLGYLALAATGLAAARLYAKSGKNARLFLTLLFFALLAAIASTKAIFLIEWHNALRGLPLFLILLSGSALWKVIVKIRSRAGGYREIAMFTFSLFSILMLGKVFFNVWLGHYAFALAVPGTCLLIITLAHHIPGKSKPAETVILALILFCIAGFARNSAFVYGAKTYPVSAGEDLMYDYPPQHFTRGQTMNMALAYIARNLKVSESFATLPAGSMLNYLSRRPSPMKYVALNVTETAYYGEKTINSALESASPSHIFLINSPAFGISYGKDIMRGIFTGYRPIGILGTKKDGAFQANSSLIILIRTTASDSAKGKKA